jgi:hypothetical protein
MVGARSAEMLLTLPRACVVYAACLRALHHACEITINERIVFKEWFSNQYALGAQNSF